MVKLTKHNLTEQLLKHIPEFKKIYEREKEYHDIGIHIVMGDFYRLAEEAIQNKNDALTKKIADFINKCYEEGDEDVHNALIVSFFESMETKALAKFYHYLTKKLAKEVLEHLKGCINSQSFDELHEMIGNKL